MNVLYVGLARTIWLFDLGLLNPTGMSLKSVVEGITQRYQFSKAPKNETDADEQKSLAFKGGTFTGRRKVPLFVGLNIYTDGFVADTMASTDDSTEFLDDLARWLNETYKLAVPKHTVAYLSQIDFQSEVPLTGINPRLKSYVEILQKQVASTSPLDVTSIQFWTEDFGKPGTPAAIRIERKISAPFSANHYFSQAPMSTRSHMESLTTFEAMLTER